MVVYPTGWAFARKISKFKTKSPIHQNVENRSFWPSSGSAQVCTSDSDDQRAPEHSVRACQRALATFCFTFFAFTGQHLREKPVARRVVAVS
jgi:hypothetical protein